MNEIEATRADVCLPDDAPCLERLRSRTSGRLVKDTMREELDQEQELDDDLNLNMDLNIDNEVTARIQDFLDESDDIPCAKDLKQRNYIFWTIHNGKFEVILGDFIDSSPRPHIHLPQLRFHLLILVPLGAFCSCFTERTGDGNISAELNNQWERDRAREAERKRLCELERIAAAVDLFTLERHGKKAHKAAGQAAASVSLGTVVGHIRRSVEDSRERSNVLAPVDGAA